MGDDIAILSRGRTSLAVCPVVGTVAMAMSAVGTVDTLAPAGAGFTLQGAMVRKVCNTCLRHIVK